MKKIMVLACGLAVILAGCGTSYQNSASAFIMNTVVNIRADASFDTVNGAIELCRNLDKRLSRTDTDAEIYKLNAAGKLQVSEDTAALIKSTLEYCEKTRGRFDISVGALSDVWQFSTATTLPEDADVKNALLQIGYKSITVEGTSVTTGGTKIDLGAVAKGYACNVIRDYFKEKGVKNALINLGGNILVMGEHESEISIKNPFKTDEIYATLKVKNTSVVTSGTYERYIEANGKKYHHILDTSTGYPVNSDIVSATVVCEDSFKADALSTVCLIYGSEKALELINATDNAECIIITADGGIHLSSGIYSDNGFYRL